MRIMGLPYILAVRFIIMLVSILCVPTSGWSVNTRFEDFEGPCGGVCGCGAGCGQTTVPYSFGGACFRSYNNTTNWTDSSHQTIGGVNNSSFFRGVAINPGGASPNEACAFFGDTNWLSGDATFYYRIARRFSSGFSSQSLEMKLDYLYRSGGNPIRNLFISSNTFRLYINYNGGYYVTNNSNNIVSHNNVFQFSNYAGTWWAYTLYTDVSTTAHEYRMWLTTENGATSCAESTACSVNGRLEFNNYLYLHHTTTGTAFSAGTFQVGHYVNNMGVVTTGATTDYDKYAISDTFISSNVFDTTPSDTTPPSVSITTPNPSAISADNLTVAGSASDAVGVSGCKWRRDSAPDGSNGTACAGTTSFSCATSGYASGANTLYVGCYDAAGNYGSDSIVVNYYTLLTAPTNLRILQ